MTELREIIANNIQELRAESGMTQAEFAKKLNYSDKAVSKWERGESLPDIEVMKSIADLFSVSLDYLVTEEHTEKPNIKEMLMHKIRNHGFITGMSILLVWVLAALGFALCDIVILDKPLHWLAFVYAVPVSAVVWLIFNSLWFDKHRNFLIVSLLMWSTLATVFLTLIMFGINTWGLFLTGVPGQFIIIMWSKIRKK